MIQNYDNRPRDKGSAFEKEWAESCRDIDDGARRNNGSGAGFRKSDVHNSLGYEFECKNVEKINIWKSIEEAERHASAAHTIPAVVFRRGGIVEPYVAIPAWHFKELVKKSKQPKVADPDRELKYLFEQAKNINLKIINKLKN